MSAEITTEETPPDVAAIRDTLASQAVDKQYGTDFAARNFATAQEVHQAFDVNGTSEAPTGEPAGEGAPPEGAPTPLILGKYKDYAALEAAHIALQAKLGAAPPTEKPPAEPAEATKGEEKGALEIKAAEVATTAGLDMASLQAEYDANGTLSEAQYAAFAKADTSLDKTVIDGFITEIAEARAIKAEAAALELKNTVGGPEVYQAMSEWAGTALSVSDLDAFNAAVNSPNTGVVQMALASLKQRYEAANGSGSTKGFVKGASGSTSGGLAPFENQAQITEAFNDPRFQSSPSFRAEVQARIAKGL